MAKEKAAATTTAVMAEADELPRTIVRRVIKEKLSEISSDGGDVTLHKEALLAFSESARIFIHYLSATTGTIIKGNKSRESLESVMMMMKIVGRPDLNFSTILRCKTKLDWHEDVSRGTLFDA